MNTYSRNSKVRISKGLGRISKGLGRISKGLGRISKGLGNITGISIKEFGTASEILLEVKGRKPQEEHREGRIENQGKAERKGREMAEIWFRCWDVMLLITGVSIHTTLVSTYKRLAEIGNDIDALTRR